MLCPYLVRWPRNLISKDKALFTKKAILLVAVENVDKLFEI